MVYRQISSKSIIGRVDRLIDASDWKTMGSLYLADAIQKIGLNHSTVNKATKGDDLNSEDTLLLDVSNHLAILPCDLEILSKVECNGYRLAYTPDVSIHGMCCDDYIWGKGSDAIDYYTVIEGYIKTSFETGKIKLFYKAFVKDDEGYIMIPDIVEFKDALVWLVLASLLLEGYVSKNSDLNYFVADEKANDKIRIARTRMKNLTKDQRAALSEMITSNNTETMTSKIMTN